MLKVLLILIFIRPFISSLAFPYFNFVYSALLTGFLFIWGIAKRVSLRKNRAFGYSIILFSLTLIISVICSRDKLNSLKELYKYIDGILILFVVVSLDGEAKIRIIRTLITTAFVISLLAIYQYIFGFQRILNYILEAKITDIFVLDYLQRKRAFFPFITPNTLGGYLIMIIPLSLIYKNRWWFVIPLSLALILTKSLGALFSILLALTLYFLLRNKIEKKEILFLLSVCLVIGLVFIIRSTTSKHHLQPIFSSMMRLSYWKDTLNIIKTNPFIGVGLGNFDLAQSRFAHNSYLQIWAEMGILGLISWFLIIFQAFKVGMKKIATASISDHVNAILGLLAAYSAFLINNLIDFSFFLPEVTLIWWVITGLILS